MTCLCTSWMKEVLFIEMGKSREGTGLGVLGGYPVIPDMFS